MALLLFFSLDILSQGHNSKLGCWVFSSMDLHTRVCDGSAK